MALHMLDTDTASYAITGRVASVRERLAAIDPASACVSVITQAELLFGLKRLAPGHRLGLAVGRFLTIVRILPWTSEAAAHYADIRYRLGTAGQVIGELDMMIAAHSMAAGGFLVTNNTRHFRRVGASLALVNWAA